MRSEGAHATHLASLLPITYFLRDTSSDSNLYVLDRWGVGRGSIRKISAVDCRVSCHKTEHLLRLCESLHVRPGPQIDNVTHPPGPLSGIP